MPASTFKYLSDVNSFPTTKLGSVNKLITENSLTRLINRLLDLDGFIITDGLAKQGESSEVIGNGGKHLVVNSDIPLLNLSFRDDRMEFVIRGYYFSVSIDDLKDMINTYIRTNSPTEPVGLYARIFIDNTNPDYPELVGQEIVEETQGENTQQVLQNGVRAVYHGVQFFVCPIREYATYSPINDILPFDNSEQVIEGLGSTYFYYDLMLLEYITNDDTVLTDGLYIPFESLNKFDSHSQRIIDGGLLTLKTS